MPKKYIYGCIAEHSIYILTIQRHFFVVPSEQSVLHHFLFLLSLYKSQIDAEQFAKLCSF